MIKIKVVYRNYKPIHDLYASFKIKPPEGVTYLIPAPRRYLRHLLPFHRRLGDGALLRSVTLRAQELLFRDRDSDFDLYHFAQLIPQNTPQEPYVVDFEHITTLANFSRIDSGVTDRIFGFLSDTLCCAVIPFSCAARRALEHLLGNRYREIEDKIKVIYPALPNYYALAEEDVDHSYVNQSAERFKLLFVGNGAYKKGLYELLTAFQELRIRYGDVELYVISDASNRLRHSRYDSAGVKFFPPMFAHDDIIRRFYLPCDLFVLPTHSDSFGMALLYSLACGTPVLTTRQFAASEIVEPGHNGLFVHSDQLYLEQVPLPSRDAWNKFRQNITVEKKLAQELVDKIEYLYLNRDKVREMGKQAVNDFEPGGKFSIDARNRELGSVYRSCLCC